MQRRKEIFTAWLRAGMWTAVGCCLFTGQAYAVSFETESGIQADWNTYITIGTTIRMQEPDQDLISTGNGGNNPNLGASAQDDGNLNFEKHDAVSTIAKVLTELELSKGDYRFFGRVKAWYDYTLSNEGVPHGHWNNGYLPGAELSDSGYDNRNKYAGLDLLDLYVQGSYEAGDNNLVVTAGRSVVNWGESLFYQGVNSYSIIDVQALRRPGAELKEALMPATQLHVAMDMPSGLTIEGFYQFGWDKTTIDSCGTFFSIADLGFTPGCDGLTLNLAPGITDYLIVNGPLPGPLGALPLPVALPRAKDREADDNGQYGLALQYYSTNLDTEFGLYHVNYHSHVPVLSGYAPGITMPMPFAIAQLTTQGQYFFEYPEDIKVFGLSAITTLFGWSVAGELSHHKDFPVQVNTVDILQSLFGAGPVAVDMGFTGPPPHGTEIPGYRSLDKTQLQLNTLKLFSDVAGASTLQLVAETAFIWADDIPDPRSGLRFGRAPGFGYSNHATMPACGTPNNGTNPWCGNLDGYTTDFAWGYKLRAALNYTNLISNATITPSVFWGHDVKGFSPDGQVLEDRKTIGLGLRADFSKKYFVDVSYTNYLDDAEFDYSRDRDFVSLSIGASY